MATLAGSQSVAERRPDVLSGSPRAHAVDRWIFVFMAAWFIAIVLAGFIPDSLVKIGMVEAGARPPFPPVLHIHAVLMGSFMLLLLGQTWLMATDRSALHMRLGVASLIVAPLLVIVGFILVPTMYHQVWQGAQNAPSEMREKLQGIVRMVENIMLLQIRVGILFPLFLGIAIMARGRNSGTHKRMMFLATAMALPAGIDRIPWLPHTMPASPLSVDLYTLAAISPMLIWDVVRNRSVHRAYWIALAFYVPFAVAIHALWDTQWWHQTARQIMGVG
ncbi:hypothetical protein ACFQPG_00935 [Sphingomonas sp. GCM10030256]|uniref:hypothetical protein n=1 Tax=Sphingomonas sp. GCM10030256 TaxID=3273427 RepID=UPI00360D377D